MAWLIAFLFSTVFGAMLFALASGFSTIEKERAREAGQSPADPPRAPRMGPANLLQVIEAEGPAGVYCATCGAPLARPNLDELLRQIERRVSLEAIAVAQFIERPSLESLYGRRLELGVDGQAN